MDQLNKNRTTDLGLLVVFLLIALSSSQSIAKIIFEEIKTIQQQLNPNTQINLSKFVKDNSFINNNTNNHNIPSPVQFTYFLVVLSRVSSPTYSENPRIIEPIVSKYIFKTTDVPSIIERGLVLIFWKLFTIQS